MGVTENTHYGPTHNPHDLTAAGGSSGGSAAVAAGLVLTLGSIQTAHLRACCLVRCVWVKADLPCRAGVASSFDHIGPFARLCAICHGV